MLKQIRTVMHRSSGTLVEDAACVMVLFALLVAGLNLSVFA